MSEFCHPLKWRDGYGRVLTFSLPATTGAGA